VNSDGADVVMSNGLFAGLMICGFVAGVLLTLSLMHFWKRGKSYAVAVGPAQEEDL
jgi:hypothetical protein